MQCKRTDTRSGTLIKPTGKMALALEPKQAGFKFHLLSLASCVTSESPCFLNLYNGAKPLTTGVKQACLGMCPKQLGSTRVLCPQEPPDKGDT